MTGSKKIITGQKGNTIVIGLISVTILGIVVVGVGKSFLSMGRQKANVQARIGVIDYEGALVSALGEKIITNLRRTCNGDFFGALDIPLTHIGSAVTFANMRAELSAQLIVNATPGAAQTALASAFERCSIDPKVAGLNDPGVYLFCLGLRGPSATQSFQGLLGAFAIFRVELGFRTNRSNLRVLGSPITCAEFRANLARLDSSAELKITYQIHYKKFKDENGIFVSSGFKFYSAP